MFNIQTIRKGRSLYPSFGPMIWLDGSDASTMTISTTISQWRDKTGNGFNANQGTGGLQPTLLAPTLNNRTVVNFNGSNGMSISSVPLSAFTIFFVFRATTGNIVYEHSVDTNSNPGSYLNVTDGQTMIVHRSGAGSNASAKNLSSSWGLGNTWRIVAQVFDGTNVGHQLFINNALTSPSQSYSIDPGLILATESLFVGSRNNTAIFLTGDIAEAIIYNNALSSQSLNNIFAFLNNKWRVY